MEEMPREAGLAPLLSPIAFAQGLVRADHRLVVVSGAAPLPLLAWPLGGVLHRPRRGVPARRCRKISWSVSSAVWKTCLIAWLIWKIGKQCLCMFFEVVVICFSGLVPAVFWYFIPPAATNKGQ